jgi:hypothetical protein
MPDRKSSFSTPWLTSSLGLLAPLLVALIWISSLAEDSSRPDSLLQKITLSSGHSTTCLDPAKSTEAVLEVDALASEIEEQDWADALDEPRVSFVIPCSFRKVSDRRLIAPRSILSHYPLRC